MEIWHNSLLLSSSVKIHFYNRTYLCKQGMFRDVLHTKCKRITFDKTMSYQCTSLRLCSVIFNWNLYHSNNLITLFGGNTTWNQNCCQHSTTVLSKQNIASYCVIWFQNVGSIKSRVLITTISRVLNVNGAVKKYFAQKPNLLHY